MSNWDPDREGRLRQLRADAIANTTPEVLGPQFQAGSPALSEALRGSHAAQMGVFRPDAEVYQLEKVFSQGNFLNNNPAPPSSVDPIIAEARDEATPEWIGGRNFERPRTAYQPGYRRLQHMIDRPAEVYTSDNLDGDIPIDGFGTVPTPHGAGKPVLPSNN